MVLVIIVKGACEKAEETKQKEKKEEELDKTNKRERVEATCNNNVTN